VTPARSSKSTLSRRTFLKGIGSVGLAAGLYIGSGEVSYRLRQASRQRAQRPRRVLTGRIVTFDPAASIIEDGAAYLDERGVIEAVRSVGAPPPTGYAGAIHIETGGDIYPGLVDLHNHPYYDLRSLWTPSRSTPYTSRAEWQQDVTWQDGGFPESPIDAYWRFAQEESMKFVELKALAGGVTTLQGLSSATFGAPFREGHLLRHVEDEQRDGRAVAESFVLRPRVADPFALFRQRMAAGTTLIHHFSEGRDPDLGREFDELFDNGCIGPRMIGVHANALDPARLRRWAGRGGAVVWSPQSNLWLYGQTTDVAAAKEAGLRICVGPDWSISGSKNLLGELKVVDLWNRQRLGRLFTDREICEMATSVPADALGLADRIGRVREGLQADLLVLSHRSSDPYRNLIEATERDVHLVIASGRPSYGVSEMLRTIPNVSSVKVGSVERAVVLPDPTISSSILNWEEIVSSLERVHLVEEVGNHIPFVTAGDVVPLDTLMPDDAYFRAIADATIPGRALTELRSYY